MNYLVQNEKYALLATPEYPLGPTLKLYRLVAMRDIGVCVKSGDHGGWVSGPANLSDQGECWVYSGGAAHSGARVMDDSQVSNNAHVSGPVVMRERSLVTGRVSVMGRIELKGDEMLQAEMTMVVNLPLHRIGQFIKNGEMVFVMEFIIGDGAIYALSVNADDCSDSLAGILCSRQVGDNVAFVKMPSGQHELLPVQPDGSLAHFMVKAVLPRISR